MPRDVLTGYNIGPAAARSLAEPRDGDSARRVGGSPSSAGSPSSTAIRTRLRGSVFNAAHLVGANGSSLGHYRKTHLFGDLDRRMFSASAADHPWWTSTAGDSEC